MGNTEVPSGEIKRTRRYGMTGVFLVVLGVALLTFTAGGEAALIQAVQPDPTPGTIGQQGNPDAECGALGLVYYDKSDGALGTPADVYPATTLTSGTPLNISWSTADPVAAVLVKAGTSINFFLYSPVPATSGSGLTSPRADSVSHVTFCQADPGAPTPTPTPTSTATVVPVTPTPTSTATATVVPVTPTPTSTATVVPVTPTPTSTATVVPATPTPAPSSAPVDPATPTPTATTTASPTPIVVATSAPVDPATPTATPQPRLPISLFVPETPTPDVPPAPPLALPDEVLGVSTTPTELAFTGRATEGTLPLAFGLIGIGFALIGVGHTAKKRDD